MPLTEKQAATIFLFSAILATGCVFGICRNSSEEMLRFVLGSSPPPKTLTLSHDGGCSDRDMSFIWIISMLVFIVFTAFSESERARAHAQALAQQPIHVPQPIQLPRTFPEDEKASIPSEECLICKENKRIYTALACGHLIACASCKQQIETRRCPLCNKTNAGWLRTFY